LRLKVKGGGDNKHAIEEHGVPEYMRGWLIAQRGIDDAALAPPMTLGNMREEQAVSFLAGYDVRQGIGRGYPSNRLKPDGVPSSPMHTSGQPRSPRRGFLFAEYLVGYLTVINLARARTRYAL
jgi:hypothetical protein